MQVTSISFDLTITSIFAPLVCGNSIDIYNEDEYDYVLNKIAKENRSTVIKLTPSHLSLFNDFINGNTDFSIKTIIVGGEKLLTELASKTLNQTGGGIEIINEYGPTEATVGCMIHRFDVDKDFGASVPIGKPAANVDVFLLSSDEQFVPYGGIGEIYISGTGLAKGYLNKPHITNDKFVIIDNDIVSNDIMYRTGDQAKWNENGDLVYLGRVDKQVKIRGFRIEIDEIEQGLKKLKIFDEVVVTNCKDDFNNEVIVAYLKGDKVYEDYEIKKRLSKSLPNAMIPTHYFYLESIPLTINGKVAFSKLPKITSKNAEYKEAKRLEEKLLLSVIEDVLGMKNLSLNDNYFHLGGDSIKAIQIASRLNQKGFKLSVKDILQKERIEDISTCIRKNEKEVEISQKMADGIIGYTPIMHWFFDQNFKNINYYNQSVVMKVNVDVSINSIKKIMNVLYEHHDMLRIRFDKNRSELYYYNELQGNGVEVLYDDFSEYTGLELKDKIIKKCENIKSSINIESGKILKMCVLDTMDYGKLIMLTANHLVVDGISWRILVEDFNNLLIQEIKGDDYKLPNKIHSHMTWGKMLSKFKDSITIEEKAYWEDIVSKKSLIKSDYNYENHIVEKMDVIERFIDELDLSGFKHGLKEKFSMEFDEALIAVVVISINRILEMDNVTIELERHGREDINDDIDVSRTVGWFTSMFPANFEVLNGDIRNKLKLIKESIRKIPNKGFNYSILRYLDNAFENNDDHYIRFNYLGDFDNIVDSECLNLMDIKTGSDICYGNNMTSLIDINAMMINRKLKLSLGYSTNRFKKSTIRKLGEEMCNLISEINELCINTNEVEFTPSDFDVLEISQDDLDLIIG